MESKHTKINLDDGKFEFSLGKSKNTDFLMKYRPLLALFLKKSVWQTKIIYTDRIVITGRSYHLGQTKQNARKGDLWNGAVIVTA